MAFKFRGGIHVAHEKERTAGKPIERLTMPKQLVLHTSQHLGKPAAPVVEKGEEVKKGQILAASSAFVSAPVHAPTSGTIADITDFAHPVLGKAKAIILEPDGKDEWVEGVPAERDWQTLSVDDLRDLIAKGGIVGLGGATFPTHVKLSPPDDTKIETVLINGAECEPYLTSDDAVMRARPKDVVIGAQIVVKTVGAKECVIGIEENKPEAIRLIEEAISGIPNFSVAALPTRYPQGAERSLIKAITNKWLPAGKLPMSLGVVVQNSTTCVAIADMVTKNIPLIEKVVSVSGPSVKDPKNVLTPVGTTWRDLIDFCGGTEDDLGRLVMGGPMMGAAQNSLDIPLIKGTSGLLALRKEDVAVRPVEACIRCGACLRACPMGLAPLDFPTYSNLRLYDRASDAHVLDCVECGCCEYSCPASRPIVHSVKVLKSKVRELQAKRENARKGV